MTAADWTCTECAADPRRAPGRACAPNRCYCAHAACHAVASWVPRVDTLATVIYLPQPVTT